MQTKMEQFSSTNPNPVLSVAKDGNVLYSNKAGEPLLREWGVGIGEKLPSSIRDIVQKVFSLNNPEKVEVKAGNRIYFVSFHPLKEEDCVNIYGFDISEQKELDQRLLHLLNEKLEASSRELRKLNEALINSESKYWHIVENSNDGIWILDRNDRTVFVNQKVSEMLGYSSYEICGHSPKKFLAPKFRSLVDDRLRKHRQKAGKFNDYQFIRKDGSDLWCIVSTHQLLDDNGKYNGSLGMLIDITERKKVEEKLQESEERYRNIVETANEGIFLVNDEAKLTYANKKIEELSGYNLKEIILRPLWDFISEESMPIAKMNFEKRRQGIDVSYELKLIRKDGSSVWGFVSAKPFFNKDGMFTGYLGMLTDITERKIAEEKLRQSEEKYRNIVETSNEGIYFVNDEGKVTFANKMMETSGYSLDEIIGRPVWNFIPKESLPVAKKEFEKRLKGISGSYELKLIRKDGSYIWTYITAKPFFNKKGKFKGYLAMMTDITERKEAEEKLQESEEKYRNIVETANEGIVTTDNEETVTFVNNKVIDMLGYAPEEVIGRPIWDFINEEYRPIVKMYLKNRRQGVNESYELELICKDGSSLWVLLNSKSLFDKDGKFMGSISMLTDVTERKEAEEKIQRLANVVESSNDSIITEALDGIITSWNKGSEHVYGYSAEEVLGKDMSIFELDDLKGEIKQLAEKIKQGKKIHHYETSQLKKDGTIINVSITLSPVFDTYGKLVAISFIAGDITEKKIAEKLLQEKQMAEVANRTKNDFLAKISHELRTPLNSIIGFSDMLLEQAYGELNKKQIRVTGNISKSGKHLLNLINNILDISKVEAGKLELKYTNFKLATKLNMIRNLLSPIADRKNIKIEIEMDINLTNIYADEDKFVQIMYNLVDNAIKFSYENSLVKIGARNKENMLEITVKDSGIGIKVEDQYKLFKPFSQIDSLSLGKSQGTGLGLSLVKQIVNLHEGYVWFKSSPEKGSIFAFAIPINKNKGNSEYASST